MPPPTRPDTNGHPLNQIFALSKSLLARRDWADDTRTKMRSRDNWDDEFRDFEKSFNTAMIVGPIIVGVFVLVFFVIPVSLLAIQRRKQARKMRNMQTFVPARYEYPTTNGGTVYSYPTAAPMYTTVPMQYYPVENSIPHNDGTVYSFPTTAPMYMVVPTQSSPVESPIPHSEMGGKQGPSEAEPLVPPPPVYTVLRD